MKILNLPDVLHEYLIHLIEARAAGGIHPEEGMALAHLWECVTKRVTTIPDTEIARMVAAGDTPYSIGGQVGVVPAPGDPCPTHVHSPTDPHIPGQPCACNPTPESVDGCKFHASEDNGAGCDPDPYRNHE
jgi:hypothetical protein